MLFLLRKILCLSRQSQMSVATAVGQKMNGFVDDLITEVVKWLEPVEKFRVRRVNKQWNRVVLAFFR